MHFERIHELSGAALVRSGDVLPNLVEVEVGLGALEDARDRLALGLPLALEALLRVGQKFLLVPFRGRAALQPFLNEPTQLFQLHLAEALALLEQAQPFVDGLAGRGVPARRDEALDEVAEGGREGYEPVGVVTD